jgi:HSP90 family molecular chaperone
MERIMRAQTLSDPKNMKAMSASRTMEINPRHPIIIELSKLASESPEEQSTKDLAWLLYDTALLTSGFSQDEPELFAERMYRTLGSSLNIKSFDLAEEIEVAVEEEDEEGESKEKVDHDSFNDEF